jgi:hypothetical protein
MATTILLILSFIINLVLLYGVRNVLRQRNQFEHNIIVERRFFKTRLADTLQKMRVLDEKGAFESDDEVGAIFKDLQDTMIDLDESTELKEIAIN